MEQHNLGKRRETADHAAAHPEGIFPAANWRRGPYSLDEEWLRPLKEGEEELYNPFDYRYLPPRGAERASRSVDSVYVQFANLGEDTREWVDFYSRYGRLGLYEFYYDEVLLPPEVTKVVGYDVGLIHYRGGKTWMKHTLRPFARLTSFKEIMPICFPSGPNPEDLDIRVESLREAKQAQADFRWVMRLTHAVARKDLDALKALLNENDTPGRIELLGLQELRGLASQFAPPPPSELFRHAAAVLNDALHAPGRSFPAIARYDPVSGLQQAGHYSLSLLGCLYTMLALDLERRPPRPCGNPRCGRFFVPVRPETAYCSDRCTHQVMQREYRLRKRQQAERLPSGTT